MTRRPTDERIARMIDEMLATRDAASTACPSEIARVLDPAGWRALMPAVRDVARALAAAGELEIRQRGRVVSPFVETRGPIRLARARGER